MTHGKQRLMNEQHFCVQYGQNAILTSLHYTRVKNALHVTSNHKRIEVIFCFHDLEAPLGIPFRGVNQDFDLRKD